MMKTIFLPFTSDMIPAAAKLLADRHARNRRKIPLYPTRFEDPQTAGKAIETLWKQKLKGGYAAFCDGEMIAYLIGEMTVQPWGRSGYVYLPGHALAEDQSPTLMQDLYALLGEGWVKKGYFHHYIYLPAVDEAVIDALFDIGFGKERVDALLDIRSLDIPELEAPAGITIRQAGSGDNAHLGNLSNVIARALAQAPYWHPTLPEAWDELHEGWSELADDPEWTVWLALQNEQALGTIGFRAEQEDATKMLVSPRTSYLSIAATQPQARGRGVNTALTWYGLAHARQQGYELCYTNWVSPNLLAARFWPRFGFQDVAYRLAKHVNPMIAWARAA